MGIRRFYALRFWADLLVVSGGKKTEGIRNSMLATVGRKRTSNSNIEISNSDSHKHLNSKHKTWNRSWNN